MDERKYRILMAIIDDYIMTAMPVGSRTLSKKREIGGLSSATIRNEMSDLEELGFLDQPHTSAGRIPSSKAYRLYVEQLLQGSHRLSAEESRLLRNHFDRRARQVEAVILNAAQAISDVTRYTAVVTLPKARSMHIRRIQLVPVAENTALLLVVTDLGIIKDTIIQVDAQLTPDHLHEISKMLTERLAGLPADQIREKMVEISGAVGAQLQTLKGILDAVEEAGQGPQGVMVGGRANLLHYPEYSDAEKARAVLGVLETRDKLLSLMQVSPQMAFTIRIGDETGMPETSGCSVVNMTYRIGEESAGIIGVIGPTRMQYARVIPVLTYMAKTLRELLSEQG